MIEWAIIGGGIHGIHLAARLIDGGLDRGQLRIISADPPMQGWIWRAEACGMDYLRSGLDAHIDTGGGSLRSFAKKAGKQDDIDLWGRPSINLFNLHCQSIIQRLNLPITQARASWIVIDKTGWNITTASGIIQAKNVVVATGQGEPEIPAGMEAYPHIFSPAIGRITGEGPIAIIGGGMTAAHMALALRRAHPKTRIAMVLRHNTRISDLDFDPEWTTAKRIQAFAELPPAERQEKLPSLRYRGSMTSILHAKLKDAGIKIMENTSIEIPKLCPHCKKPTEAPQEMDLLKFSTGEVWGGKPQVILATGYRAPAPMIPIALTKKHAPLPVHEGAPLPNARLRWAKGLYLMGAHAEMVLGPAARNIMGARLAAERILG